MTIRLYTEDKQRHIVLAACERRFQSFTIQEVLGVWKGTSEKSLIITFAQLDSDALESHWFTQQAKAVAYDIKHYNEQESVLMEVVESRNQLI